MSSAALFAYIVTGAVGLPHGYWAVITCLVIIQGSLGATIGAGLQRLAGTASGGAMGGVGALLLHLWPHIPEWAVLLLVIAPLSVLAASRAIFKLAPLTGALVLLLAGNASLGFAVSRILQIGLGTAIGILFALFVLPQRATASLLERAATLLEIQGGLAAILITEPESPARDRFAIRLRAGFAQLQTDMTEIRHERTAHLLRAGQFPEQLVRHLQRLRTDVNMLGRAADNHGEGPAMPPGLAGHLDAIFRGYAAFLRGQAYLPPDAPLDDPRFAIASDSPLGFALLTLQLELKALHATLSQWRATPP